MEKLYFLNFFFLIIFLALFLWQTIFAILKYLDGTTIAATTFTNDGSILYPSVTVCKKFMNGIDEDDFNNKSMVIEDQINKLSTNIWRKDEVFYFATHTNMFNLSFPCTTVNGRGTTPGKPCSFPYVNYHGLLIHQPSQPPDNFCYTRYPHHNHLPS